MIHFVTFADNWMRKSRDRLVIEAKNSGFFNEFHVFGEEHLPQDMVTYCKGKHGFGHYIWKSYVVDNVLNKIAEDEDILVWVDAGSTIQKEGKWRFDEYIDMVKQSKYANVSFENSDTYCPEKYYTKADIFHYFHAENLVEGIQLSSGVILLRNVPYTRCIVSIWKEATLNNLHLSEDDASIRGVPNYPGFRNNRQDQSIFSIIRRKYGTTIIPHPVQGLKLTDDNGKYIVPEPFFCELDANWCPHNSALVGNKIYPIVTTRLRY